MSNPSQPTVGRAVHYVSLGSRDGVYLPKCRAATVTEVNDLVSLVVFNPTGIFFDQNVPYNATCEPGTWHWPGRDGEPCEPAYDVDEGPCRRPGGCSTNEDAAQCVASECPGGE